MGCLKLNIENPTLLRVLNGGKLEFTKKCVDTSRFAYSGMEKDPEIKGEGNSYTTEFRQYDPRLGRWLSCDPKRHWFPDMSAYCYASNTPIAGKDDNGLYTIFINGYTNGLKPGKSDDCPKEYFYWRGARKDKGQFIRAAHEYFGDGNHEYLDGSSKGITSTAWYRKEQGRLQAVKTAAEIKQKIKEGMDIREINIVTHSMGAAYAEGLIEVFMEDKELAALLRKGEIVHFSAADANFISISENSKDLKRTQLNYTQDLTLMGADGAVGYSQGGHQISGVTRFGVVQSDLNKMHPNYDLKAIQKYGLYDFHFDSKTFDETWKYLKVLNNRIESNPNNYNSKIKFEDINDNWDHRDGSTGQQIPENHG